MQPPPPLHFTLVGIDFNHLSLGFLSESERGTSGGESKDPEDLPAAMLHQEILSKDACAILSLVSEGTLLHRTLRSAHGSGQRTGVAGTNPSRKLPDTATQKDTSSGSFGLAQDDTGIEGVN
jgi:hypothetical protein